MFALHARAEQKYSFQNSSDSVLTYHRLLICDSEVNSKINNVSVFWTDISTIMPHILHHPLIMKSQTLAINIYSCNTVPLLNMAHNIYFWEHLSELPQNNHMCNSLNLKSPKLSFC